MAKMLSGCCCICCCICCWIPVYGSTYMDMTLKTESTDGHQPSNFYQAPPGMDVELGGVNPALYRAPPSLPILLPTPCQ